MYTTDEKRNMDRKDEQRLPSYFLRITKERAMDSNRIKDIDARHGTQNENGNGARDAAMRKTGKEVQDLAGGSRENERGAHKNGRTREGARNGMRGGARPGAGRPRGDSRMISFRAPGALADELEKVENRTEFIKKSISEALLKKERVLKNAETEENLEQGGISVTEIRRGWKTETEGGIESGKKSEWAEDIGRIGDVIPAGKVAHVNIPFFDIRVVAGFPVPLDNDEKSQDIDLIRMLCPHPEASYLIRVNGDSMIDAGVLSGDIVIVDKSNRNPSPREIAMCELNGEYTLKHFRMEDGQGWLVPANPDYPRIRISPEDDFSVWGTVTFIIHKPRD